MPQLIICLGASTLASHASEIFCKFILKTLRLCRSGRTKQWLKALAPLLYSPLSEIVALALFQFVMEASVRKGSDRIKVTTVKNRNTFFLKNSSILIWF